MTGLDALATRYARGLAEYAKERGEFDAVRDDLAALRDWLDPAVRDEDGGAFAAALRGRVLDRDARVALCGKVCRALGIGETVTRFLAVLIRHDRTALFLGVLRAYDGIALEVVGDHTVHVETARELDAAQTERLRLALSANAGGARVNLVVTVVPRLMAGMRLRLGDRRWDGSARGRMRRLIDLVNAQAL